MNFRRTPLPGVVLLEPVRRSDERGYFARTFCVSQFEAMGLDPTVRQCSTSYNARAGTLRGMHYQTDPYAETKLVRCTRGAIFDVIVDLRPESEAYCAWAGFELSADNGVGLYVPVGLAHGFQTLADDSEVLYMMGQDYVPEAARGVRFDDPAFAITWPAPPEGGRVVSARDLEYAPFSP